MTPCPTDWVAIITIVASLFAVLGVMIGLFLYLASKIDTKFDFLSSKIESLKSEMHLEMKDFHGRLCSLEEKYRSPKTEP